MPVPRIGQVLEAGNGEPVGPAALLIFAIHFRPAQHMPVVSKCQGPIWVSPRVPAGGFDVGQREKGGSASAPYWPQ